MDIPTPENGKPPPPPPVGLTCAHCGCNHFYTVRTVKQVGSQVMRQKECRHCGKRLMTYEKAFGR